MKSKLLRAYHDIAFLQSVERVHVEMNIGRGEKDNKRLVRDVVRREMVSTTQALRQAKSNKALKKLNHFNGVLR